MVALSALEHYFQHSFTLDEDGLFDNEVTLYSTRIWHLKWLWALLGKHTKFLPNISKIVPSRPKKHRDMGCEYHYRSLLI